MIGQYLSNTNEKATVSILQNILELNKAPVEKVRHMGQAATGQAQARTTADAGGEQEQTTCAGPCMGPSFRGAPVLPSLITARACRCRCPCPAAPPPSIGISRTRAGARPRAAVRLLCDRRARHVTKARPHTHTFVCLW